MNYELAKQLKDAGFPQVDLGGFNFGDDLNYPTLSELIEACGKNGNNYFAALYNQMSEWQATSIYNDEGKGSTPEEPVANLWLALNKK